MKCRTALAVDNSAMAHEAARDDADALLAQRLVLLQRVSELEASIQRARDEQAALEADTKALRRQLRPHSHTLLLAGEHMPAVANESSTAAAMVDPGSIDDAVLLRALIAQLQRSQSRQRGHASTGGHSCSASVSSRVKSMPSMDGGDHAAMRAELTRLEAHAVALSVRVEQVQQGYMSGK